MLETLSDKLARVLKNVRGQGKLTEANVESALREVKLSLLEADVNFAVVKDFIASVKEKALGEEVLLSLTPGQQFTRVVHDELAALLGGETAELELKGSPAVLMLVGLQGSGKTTTTAKLARLIKSRGRDPFIVPADLARPAAVEQLKKLSASIKVDCFDVGGMTDPREICREALRVAGIKGYDTMLVDTAGRMHVDDGLMDELKELKRVLSPVETLLVADAMTGQDAVTTAAGFNDAVGITGVILTKLDGDARGGAALSMRMVTGSPIKFVGLGEKVDSLEVFHPERLAGRILGMGDVLTLAEKAYEAIDEKKAKEIERKIRKDSFTLQDFRDQLRQVKGMGSLDSVLSMLPGFDAMKKSKGFSVDEKELVRTEAIIDSMTVKERLKPAILNARRRVRIAGGSGTRVQDVNRLIKQYAQMRKMMKKFKKGGMPDIRAFSG
ncbi:MAG: signal recognition particle protein [Thermodesulfobacteriota bacterium]